METPGLENFDMEAGNLQHDVQKLIESTGLTDICKGIGFMDRNSEIEKSRRVYDAIPINHGNVTDPSNNNHTMSAIAVAQQVPTAGIPPSRKASRKRKTSDLPSSPDDDDDDFEDSVHEGNKKKRRNSKSKGNKGLRHFSKKVCDKVKAKKTTTYNEVADELVKELTQASELSGGRVDSKNIRRRVYDALNVLMAMNIIEKEKKEIRWRGLPTTDVKRELESLQQEKQQRIERIQKKKEYLFELDTQKLLYKNLIERNCRSQQTDDDRIYLPFIIIHTKKQTTIECEMSEDRTEYFFDFSLPFSIHDDNEILKRMGLSDPAYVERLNTVDRPIKPDPALLVPKQQIPITMQQQSQLQYEQYLQQQYLQLHHNNKHHQIPFPAGVVTNGVELGPRDEEVYPYLNDS